MYNVSKEICTTENQKIFTSCFLLVSLKFYQLLNTNEKKHDFGSIIKVERIYAKPKFTIIECEAN